MNNKQWETYLEFSKWYHKGNQFDGFNMLSWFLWLMKHKNQLKLFLEKCDE